MQQPLSATARVQTKFVAIAGERARGRAHGAQHLIFSFLIDASLPQWLSSGGGLKIHWK